jgi:hypothetical protein
LKAELRNKDHEMEELEERHQLEIKVSFYLDLMKKKKANTKKKVFTMTISFTGLQTKSETSSLRTSKQPLQTQSGWRDLFETAE